MKRRLLIISTILIITKVSAQSYKYKIRDDSNALAILQLINEVDKNYVNNINTYVNLQNDSIKNLYILNLKKSFSNRDTLKFLRLSSIVSKNNIKPPFFDEIFNIYLSENGKKFSKYINSILLKHKLNKKQTEKVIKICEKEKKNLNRKYSRICTTFRDFLDYNILNKKQKQIFINKDGRSYKINTIKTYEETIKLLSTKQQRNYFHSYYNYGHSKSENIRNDSLFKHLISVLGSKEPDSIKENSVSILRVSNKVISKENKDFLIQTISLNKKLPQSIYFRDFSLELDSSQIKKLINFLPLLSKNNKEIVLYWISNEILTNNLINKIVIELNKMIYFNSDKRNNNDVSLLLKIINHQKKVSDDSFNSLLKSLLYQQKIINYKQFKKLLTLCSFSNMFSVPIKINSSRIDSILIDYNNFNLIERSYIDGFLYYNKPSQKQLKYILSEKILLNNSIYKTYKFFYKHQQTEIIPNEIAIDSILDKKWYNIEFNTNLLTSKQIDRLIHSDILNNNNNFKEFIFTSIKNQTLTKNQVDYLLKRIYTKKDYIAGIYSGYLLGNNIYDVNQFKLFYKLYKRNGIINKHRFDVSRSINIEEINLNNYYPRKSNIFLIPYLINKFFKETNGLASVNPFTGKGNVKKLIYQYSYNNKDLIELIKLIQPNQNLKELSIKKLYRKDKSKILGTLNYISKFFENNKEILDKNSKVYFSNLVKDIIVFNKNKWSNRSELNKCKKILKFNNNENILNNYLSFYEKCKNKKELCLILLPLILGFILILFTFLFILFSKDSIKFEKQILLIIKKLDSSNKIKILSIILFLCKNKLIIKKLLKENKEHLLSNIKVNDIKDIKSHFYPNLIVYPEDDKKCINPIEFFFNKLSNFFLIGESGIGKSTLLINFAIKQEHFTTFIRSSEFTNSIKNTILNKVEGLLKNKTCINYVLKKGLLLVIFDGLNELSPSQQDSILSEIDIIDGNGYKKIIVSSQKIPKIKDKKNKIIVKGVPKDEIYKFLIKYKSSEHFESRLDEFIKISKDEDNIKDLLHNPMDLFIISRLLNTNNKIHSSEIYNQYFNILLNDFNSEKSYIHRDFDKSSIYKEAYKIISSNNILIKSDTILLELKFLLKYKIANNRIIELDKKSKTEWYFRHDKIASFFASKYLLEHQDLRLKHIEDIKFKNTYIFLAESLPISELKDDILKIREIAMHTEIIDNTSILEKIYQKRKKSR